MKYVIPVVDHESAKYQIADGLNLSKFMCSFDADSNGFSWELSKDILPIGNNWIEICKQKQIKGLILRSINSMAYNMFTRHGFEVYKASTTNVQQAIEMLKENRLSQFCSEDFGGTGCSGSCSTCESDDKCDSKD